MHTQVGIGVFIFKSKTDNRFVLGKRKGSLGSGTYGLAGGRLDFGESFQECASREAFEETGLKIGGINFVTALETVLHADNHWLTVFMSAYVIGEQQDPELLEPDKCDGWEWTTFSAMRDFPSQGRDLFEPLNRLIEGHRDVCSKLELGHISS